MVFQTLALRLFVTRPDAAGRNLGLGWVHRRRHGWRNSARIAGWVWLTGRCRQGRW